MNYKDYTIEQTKQGYHITTPAGATLAMSAVSVEAAQIRVDCHRERRLPTRDEQRILHPKLFELITYPAPRKRRSTAVAFGNRVFVGRGA